MDLISPLLDRQIRSCPFYPMSALSPYYLVTVFSVKTGGLLPHYWEIPRSAKLNWDH